jgi:hypothetical protein
MASEILTGGIFMVFAKYGEMYDCIPHALIYNPSL